MNASRFALLKKTFQDVLGMTDQQRSQALAKLADDEPEIAATLRAWLAAEAGGAADWLDEPAAVGLPEPAGPEVERQPAVAAPPERVGAWRLEAEIGRGGMGSVFRGHRDDGAFAQTVAVKLVRSELASEVLRRRFLAERRILAGLVHPNIAHLIDGGATAEGVPYLVLEYVAGEPIDRYCDQRALPVAERLRLFVAVCGAVHFAHQQLVLHRDLKAANVLVDGAGHPKLLDFGIAKLLEPTAAQDDWTALGLARPLTPEWASPEQLRGEPLSTASDVYSLGILLHVLLTGRRPHRFGAQSRDAFAAEIVAQGGRLRLGATEAAATPPGVNGKSLRGDLHRILERALAPEAARRYGSAAELAGDLERHLAGLPVAAHPPSARYRLGKFLRRHRAGAVAATVAALSLAAAAVVSLHQARIAERERGRAERRFTDVRRLANVALFDIHDALEKVAGTMPARRLLVDQALRYLDDLAREAGSDAALLAELAAAYERVGTIQGMPGWSSEGRTGDALTSFERALEIERRSQALADRDAGAPVDNSAEARLLTRIGSIRAARGDAHAALTDHRAALALLEHRVANLPAGGESGTATRLALAQTQVAVGDDVWWLGDIAGSTRWYKDALATAHAAAAADPSTAAIRQTGVAEQRLGDAAAEAGDWGRAVEHHSASLAVDRQLAARRLEGTEGTEGVADAELRRDLGTDLSRLGDDQARRGFAAEALELHREAIRFRETLLGEESGDARAADDAAESHLEAAKALVALGRHTEAIREASTAVGRWRGLVDRDPSNALWRDSIASALTVRADAESRVGDRRSAAATWAEVLAIRRRLLTDTPDLASNREALAKLERAPLSRSSPSRPRSHAPSPRAVAPDG
ncbi:MAG: serine/threonine-protein kinase [Acidobacteriota bacterium]